MKNDCKDYAVLMVDTNERGALKAWQYISFHDTEQEAEEALVVYAVKNIDFRIAAMRHGQNLSYPVFLSRPSD